MNSTAPNLATEARLQHLVEQLDASGAIRISEAAAALDVSEMTIRRDIAELEERGLARRIRGGALPLGPQSFSERTRTQARSKARIASKLARFIPETGTIAFDASSTVMRAAAALTGATDLTIVTNGPETFSALQRRPGVTPVLTGGLLDPRTGSLVGPLASWSARQIIASRVIASSAGVHPEIGWTETVLDEADVKRSFVGTGSHVVLAVDSTKLGQRGTAVCFDWSEIDVLVTDLEPNDPRLDPYRSLAELV